MNKETTMITKAAATALAKIRMIGAVNEVEGLVKGT
jgi:hypothetical protein